MLFNSNSFLSWICFVMLFNFSQSILSLNSEPRGHIWKLCDHSNNSCFNDILVQRFIIFNSAGTQNITIKLGNLNALLTLNKTDRFTAKLHTERRAYLVPSNTNEIVINAICEFTYDDDKLPYIDHSFCCRVDLELGSADRNRYREQTEENPYAYCELKILPKPTYCFVPIKVKTNGQSLLDKAFPLIAKVYSKKSGSCDHRPVAKSIYSVAPAVTVSFTHNLPVIWMLSSSFPSKILLGVPVYSTNIGENLLVPVRLISDRANLNNQIINVQCLFDQHFYFNAAITNYPNVSVVNNFTFSNNLGYFINIRLKITPGLDQQLMFLNLTVVVDSRERDTINSAKLQCCINPTDTVRQKKSVCKNARFVDILLKQSYAIPVIPAVNDSVDLFSIYEMPNITFLSKYITVYGITNYKDKIVKDITVAVSMYPVQSNYLTVPDISNKLMDIDMRYQTFLNPWSMQLHFYNSLHTVISPVRIWRPTDWKLVLSNNVLQPIKNWAVPESLSDNAICVSRYTVARLKILCRLYIIEETGDKRYIGAEKDSGDQIPYVDVTSMTEVSQLKITSDEVISIHKSVDQDHFLVSAKQVGQYSDIHLVSPGSQLPLVSTRVSVDLRDLYVTDLIVHCIDALSLGVQNRSINSINRPSDYESVTVSLTSNSLSKPCYLVVFVVYNDKSIERISSINQNQYRLIVTRSESGGIIDTPIKDSQQVIIRYLPHVNMSLYEPSTCRDSRLVFIKRIEWVTVESLDYIVPVTRNPTVIQTTINKNISHHPLFNGAHSINPVHISIYICTGIVAFCFMSFVLYKLFCFRNRSRNDGSSSTNYQRSGSGFLDDSNMKIAIRTTNSKSLSPLNKCSTNCLRQNINKAHTNEPYPPLLPPPGPIAANYDLTLIDPVCSDSAVDSGVELGKLSSYSSNTCPSNDLCCTMDLYPSCSVTEDSIIHQPYPPPQFANPMMGFYSQKGALEPDNQYHDSIMLSSLNSTKAISNLRHPYW